MSGPDGEWRLVREETRSGAMQMALEEAAAETAAAGGPRTVRVYRWEPSTLSLGYGQDPETVDWEYCDRTGVDVVRRQTGGGGIYHDATGDVSYSIVAPAEEFPGTLLTAYEQLCEPLFDAFDRIGIDAGFAEREAPAIHRPACYLRALDPAHDVVVGGRKISGNAQYRQRDSVIQHGSITFERAAEQHCAVFAADLPADRFRERVTSAREAAGVDRDRVVEALEAALAGWAGADVGEWTEEELDRAGRCAREKYATEAWTRRRPV
ncbi:MAG: biotin/lipoate A/B protein ligase family protein [Salinirussus sp.]